MKAVRLAAIVAAALLLLTGLAARWVPIEETTCPQAYGDLFGGGGSTLGLYGQTTAWDCWGAIQLVRQKDQAQAREEYARSHPSEEQKAQWARAAALAELEAKMRAEQQRLELSVKNENEAAVMAQFRGALCPLLAAKSEGEWSLTMIAGKADVLVYGLEVVCRGCMYKREPAWTRYRLDGSTFCKGGGYPGDDCPEQLRALEARVTVSREGRPEALRALLGCAP